MSRRENTPAQDPRRKARFREEAREIVAKDRHDRKYGYAVDTAGSIARALERAYKQGFMDGQNGSAPSATEIPDGQPLEWALIPPRPRTAFWSCCLFILGRAPGQQHSGHLEPAITERGTPGWRLCVDGYPHLDRVMGANTIGPLIKLGLLEADPTIPQRLIPTGADQYPWAQSLRPMDMILQGCSATVFQAAQQ